MHENTYPMPIPRPLPLPEPRAENPPIMGILAVGLIAFFAGYQIGKSMERQSAMRLISNPEDIRGFLTQEQRSTVQFALDAGAKVVERKVGSMVVIMLERGMNRFERMFIAPSIETPVYDVSQGAVIDVGTGA